jgi:hypothetical protein
MPERSSKSSEVYTLSLMASLTGSINHSTKTFGRTKEKEFDKFKEIIKNLSSKLT